jgi:tetraacyldisaccharide 4'-kinase
MARRLGTPVVVGEDRYLAGVASEKENGRRLHLLDDGFQHRRLKRQFDIVLVSPEDLKDKLMPAGRLREPASALLRADAVILPSGAMASELPPGVKQIWYVKRGLAKMEAPSRPLVFCGIARPQRFLSQLKTAGVEPAGVEIYRDHHVYTEADVRHLVHVGESNQADGFVTTEKDAINLGLLCAQLHPLTVATVEVTLENAEQCIDSMLKALQARGKALA